MRTIVTDPRARAAALARLVVMGAALAATAPRAAAWTLVDLGPAGMASGASAIGGDGTVGGYVMAGPAQPHAVLFRDGRFTDLGTLGGDASFAAGAARGGLVVGWARRPDANRHAFLWRDGAMRDLGTLGGAWSQAFGVEAGGTVVGSSLPVSTSDEEVPVVWNAADGMRALPVPQVHGGQAHGINPRGDVVGYVIDDVMVQPFLCTHDGRATILPTLGGTGAKAYAISDSGLIAGYALTADEFPKFHPVLWRNGVIHDLPPLAAGHGVAYGVNDAGTLVGFSYDANFEMHATLHDSAGVHDLNDILPLGSPWVLNMATGITAAGVVSGTGTLAGESHGFVLVPDFADGRAFGLVSDIRLRAWPQPMTQAGTITIEVSGLLPGAVSLYDVTGRRVAQLASGTWTRGAHELPVPPGMFASLRSGVYWARFEAPGATASRRIVVVR